MTLKRRVAMLMSGGVDSSVAAALLKEQGYEVIGFYILGWMGNADFPCPWQKEEQDARLVAEQLDIPFYTVNLSKEYEQEVIDEFFRSYQLGATPNPDILCNRQIKFKAFWKSVRQFEPDYLATGHYAKISHRSGLSRILKATDTKKDQTYFLWGIDPAVLPNILFPLGGLTKAEVRSKARALKLATANKKDSQGICFIGPLKVREFLASKIKTVPGKAYLENGQAIAEHRGVQFYTIGQRLAAGSVSWTGDVPPLFVLAKDVRNNRLIVGPDSHAKSTKLNATDLNWLTPPKEDKFVARAKIRYGQEDVRLEITLTSKHLHGEFFEPVRSITAGQSLVLYDQNGQLLGGGIIGEVPEQDEKIRQLAQALEQISV